MHKTLCSRAGSGSSQYQHLFWEEQGGLSSTARGKTIGLTGPLAQAGWAAWGLKTATTSEMMRLGAALGEAHC